MFFFHRILLIRLKNHENAVFFLIVQIEMECVASYYAICTLQMFWHAMQKEYVRTTKKRCFIEKIRVRKEKEENKKNCVVGKIFNILSVLSRPQIEYKI